MTINWNDDKDKTLFKDAGICSFHDLAEIENRSDLKLHCMRRHANRKTQKIDRKIFRLELDSCTFYLKWAAGTAFKNIRNEYEAISILPEFNLKPAEIAGWLLDDEAQQGIIILKEL